MDEKAEKIYTLLFGKPKTHEEWANKFNIKHNIKKIITGD